MVVIDAIKWGLEDHVVNLNEQLSFRHLFTLGRFDLVVDPGTLEHCFDIAQAFDNVCSLLAEGGFVVHEAAIAFLKPRVSQHKPDGILRL